MTPPSAERLFAVLDATWPAARVFDEGPWRFRDGQGGGQRVSATTASSAFTGHDIPAAESQMRALGQRSLFMVRDSDDGLDRALAERKYEIVDPVTLYIAEAQKLAAALPITAAMPSWPPLAVQLELWSAGGIGPARIAVMERADAPKTTILGRTGDAPVGTGFVAIHDTVAMVHALEVDPKARRKGVGLHMMQAAANWALENGGDWVALAVTRANMAANALYQRLGMTAATQYHYRRAPEPAA